MEKSLARDLIGSDSFLHKLFCPMAELKNFVNTTKATGAKLPDESGVRKSGSGTRMSA